MSQGKCDSGLAKEQEVQLTFQPANSPDLQPRKNIGAFVKARVERETPQTLAVLRNVLEAKWDNLTMEDVAPLKELMHRHMA